MCQEVKEIKEKYHYNFSQLLNEENYDELEDIASELWNKLKKIDVIKNERIGDCPDAVQILAIANYFGFYSYLGEFDKLNGRYKGRSVKEASGMISISHDYIRKFGTDKILVIKSNDNIGHQRFAVAHELAHFLFDFNEQSMISYSNFYIPNEQSNLIEERANRFAASILMPKDIFIVKYNEYKKENYNLYELCSKLADCFLVPSTAVNRRINELKKSKDIVL